MGRATPQSHHPRSDARHTHEHREPLDGSDFTSAWNLPTPCLSVFTHSFTHLFTPCLPPPSIQNYILELHWNFTACLQYPGKVTTCQEETTERSPPGRPAKNSKNFPSPGNQPSGTPATGGARGPMGASDSPVIQITGNRAVAAFLGT